jgi:hypothetical protein
VELTELQAKSEFVVVVQCVSLLSCAVAPT